MSRRRKPKTILGMILFLIFAPLQVFFELVMSYKPYNSTGRKISRSKKKKWF